MATRRSSLTPQFEWNDSTAQYRWLTGPNKGDFVPRLTVRSALDDYTQAKEAYAIELSEKLRNREISFKVWQQESERTLAKIHLAHMAAAKGGWHRLNSSDFGFVGSLVKQELGGVKGEHKGFRGLVQAMNEGLPLDGHWMQRIRQFTHAGRHTYHVVETRDMEARGADEERSVLGVADHCSECVAQAKLKWQKIKSKKIKQPGDRKCRRFCQCGKRYRNSQTGQVF